jgi:hypothetical protein
VPAWPPGASRSTTIVRRPADDHRVVLGGARLGRDVEQLGDAAELRPHDGLPVHDPNSGVVAVGRQGPPPLLGVGRHVGLQPPERDLIAVEEPPQLRAGGVPAVAEHDGPIRGRLGSEALQAAGAADAIGCEETDGRRDAGRGGRDHVIVARLDTHHPRGLRGPEADGERGAQRDRHLAEDLSGVALADDARYAVDELDCLDTALEHAEERPLVTFVDCVLARPEADVGGDATQLLTVGRVERFERRDAPDLVGRHHVGCPCCTARGRVRVVPVATGQGYCVAPVRAAIRGYRLPPA